eukprot:365479-Chlamydomonas_euryale.AAC.7
MRAIGLDSLPGNSVTGMLGAPQRVPAGLEVVTPPPAAATQRRMARSTATRRRLSRARARRTAHLCPP